VRYPLALVILVAVSLLAPVKAAASVSQAAPAAAKTAPASVININTASAAQFEALPGIGAKTAARIVEYRQKNGGFKKIEELMNVRGIGEKLFLRMKGQLTVTSPKADPQ
jgi:competence protein ComEA